MLSILPKPGAKMATRLLGAAATVLVTLRTLLLLIFISLGTNALREMYIFASYRRPRYYIEYIRPQYTRNFFPT